MGCLLDSHALLWTLEDSDAEAAGRLPPLHRDPSDRIIAAQAIRSGLTVITKDPAIAKFGAAVFW